jgi:hypothetical protein
MKKEVPPLASQKHELTSPEDMMSSSHKRPRSKNYETSSSEEGEEDNRFRVIIEDRNSIYEAIKKSKSGKLGEVLLKEPVIKASVFLSKDIDEFGISAEIKTNDYHSFEKTPFSSPDLGVQDIIHEMIYSKYDDAIEEDQKIFLHGNNNTKFVVNVKNRDKDVEISTIKANPDEVLNALKDLNYLLYVSIDAIYSAEGKKIPPYEKLILYPPEEKPDVSFDNIDEQEAVKR